MGVSKIQVKSETAGKYTPGLPWKMRAIQLDLARHMETVDYIKRYTDFSAENGFNALVLYLEARVRTPKFSFRPKSESYTLEEMAQVVSHARKAGVDVVPVISTLGHTEQFLACKELGHLSELRNGAKGRFGTPGPGMVVCPSLDETYAFFASYFGEIAQVFTGEHIHIGLDEVWDLGSCPLCRKRLQEEGLGGIFTGHLQRINKLVLKHWKRTWFWEDMYEIFPEELVNTPKNAVMCHWQYDDVISREGIKAHFTNRYRRNWLADYEKLDLDALICPWVIGLRNVETFTDYGRRERILGGLMTQWEGTPRFQGENALAVAFSGRLWSQPWNPEKAWQQAVKAVVPGLTGIAAEAVEQLMKSGRPHLYANTRSYLAGPLTGEELLQRNQNRLALAIMAKEQVAGLKIKGPAVEVLEHLEISGRTEQLYWELRDILPEIYHPRRLNSDVPALQAKLAALQKELKALTQWRGKNYLKMPNRHPTDNPLVHWQKVAAMVDEARQKLAVRPGKNDWLLILRLFLQDHYGAPFLKITVSAGKEEFTFGPGGFKPNNSIVKNRQTGHYDLQLPFTLGKTPENIRIEGWGYGGQGVCFVELQNPTITLYPGGIKGTRGLVNKPEAILLDDTSFAYFGCADIRAEMLNSGLADQRGLLDLSLKAGREITAI